MKLIIVIFYFPTLNVLLKSKKIDKVFVITDNKKTADHAKAVLSPVKRLCTSRANELSKRSHESAKHAHRKRQRRVRRSNQAPQNPRDCK